MELTAIQKWCYTDAEYEAAMKMQQSHDNLDPKHEKLARIIVIDCRERY